MLLSLLSNILIVIRSMLFYITVYIVSISVIMIGAPIWFFAPIDSWLLRKHVTFLLSAISMSLRLICNVSTRVEGLNNLPKDKAAILMMRHESWYDATALAKHLNGRISAIAKQQITKFPMMSQMAKRTRSILIDRESLSSLKIIFSKIPELIDLKYSILIFPEGSRIDPNEKVDFKSGILAIRKRFPELDIIPISTNSGDVIKKDFRIIPNSTIIIRVLPQIDKKISDEEFLEKSRDIIYNESQKLRKDQES